MSERAPLNPLLARVRRERAATAEEEAAADPPVKAKGKGQPVVESWL